MSETLSTRDELPPTRQTDVQSRIELAMQVARKSIEDCPWTLAERVARHYLKLSNAAATLLRLRENVRSRDYIETNESRTLEVYLLDLLSREYANDFGDDPAWWKALFNLKRFHKDMPVCRDGKASTTPIPTK
jgi:hypothetical protein